MKSSDFLAFLAEFYDLGENAVPVGGWKFSRAVRLLPVAAGGLFYAAALPPWNWSWCIFFALVPLFGYAAQERKFAGLALGGLVWGIGWALPGFRFLREIEPVIPFLLAPVLSIWLILFTCGTSLLWRFTAIPPVVRCGGCQATREFLRQGGNFWRMTLFALGSAALFVLLEWSRSHLLPWNGLEIALWRFPAAFQLAAWTGAYGVSFVIALVNSTLFCAIVTRFRGAGLRLFLAALLIFALNLLGGSIRLLGRKPESPNWFPTLIQGDLSQRRHATAGQAVEAVRIYSSLSVLALEKAKTDVVIWPESAVPLLFRSTDPLSLAYRNHLLSLVRNLKTPFLIGAIDFESSWDKPQIGVTNSALFFSADGRLSGRADKFHRVPFGEYIPFRSLLPEALTRRIDMGRDLVPGKSLEPMPLDKEVRAGVAICFEGVFSYVMRQLARRGANVLVVLSNDAWYPASSEPEQHLANARMRTVETGLPMVRCGNNGGSLWLDRYGCLRSGVVVSGTGEWYLRRGRGFARIGVPVEPEVKSTFFVHHGAYFILLLWVFFGAAAAVGISSSAEEKRRLKKVLQEGVSD